MTGCLCLDHNDCYIDLSNWGNYLILSLCFKMEKNIARGTLGRQIRRFLLFTC